MITNTNTEAQERLLTGLCKRQWKRCGVKRRAGVATPLFSLYSERSVGIGEIPDLKLLMDWCHATKQSVVQLLPMNDVGYDFTPYDAQSTFALEPMYLSLEHLRGIDLAPYKRNVSALKKQFPADTERVDYGIKHAKLDLLWRLFQENCHSLPEAFHRYVEATASWLNDYALFKVIKEKEGEKDWSSWDVPLKNRDASALAAFARAWNERITFHQWLQWQLAAQFEEVKAYAKKTGVLLLGDLPFLVSRDSADVWSHQDYFKLELASGSPPDLYFAKGQRWGMPPYHWQNIANHGYDYLVNKLQYAERFYDLFRLDHVVGVFRIWTIPVAEPPENAGANGTFDPKDESLWEEQGRRLLTVMAQATTMLPCAEDLGTVPECSYRVLDEFGIPGMDVQRWVRDWEGTKNFLRPEDYRLLSIAVISTHDMPSLRGWWEHEMSASSAEERQMFWDHLGLKGLPEKKATPGFARRTLGKISEAASLFSIQLLQDWLSLDPKLERYDSWEYRINFPGTTGPKNWTLRSPFSLEEIQELPLNSIIEGIHAKTQRR